MNDDKSWRWIALGIAAIGLAIVAGGIALGWGSLRLVLHGEEAPGEVMELAQDGAMYVPVIRFRLRDGTWHEVRDLGTGAPDFAVGDRVTVLYQPGDPDKFAVDTFDRLWLNALIVTGFGGFWLLFAGVAWGLSRGIDLPVLGESMFAVIAGGALLVAIAATWIATALYTSGLRTEGEVLEIRITRTTEREEIDGDRRRTRNVERTSYAPVVRFTTREGREIEFHGRGGSDTAHRKGDRVTVIYDPARPINARILSFLDLWLPATVAWVVALLFGGVVRLSRASRLRSSR